MPPKRKTGKKTASKAKHVRTVKKVIAELQSQGPVVVAPGVLDAAAAVVVPATATQPAMVVPAAPSGIPMAPTMPTNMQIARAESSFEKMLAAKRSGLTHRSAEELSNYNLTHKSADQINALYHPVTHPELAGVSCNPGYYWDTVKQNCEPRKTERATKYEAICGPGFTYSATEKKCMKNSQQYN